MNTEIKTEKSVQSEPCLSESLTGLIRMNAEILLLCLVRCLVLQDSMRSLRVVKLDISINCRSEIFLRAIFCTIEFFFFQWKKLFGHSLLQNNEEQLAKLSKTSIQSEYLSHIRGFFEKVAFLKATFHFSLRLYVGAITYKGE